MKDTQLSYRLRDPEVISKIQQVAASQGARDWRKFARTVFESALARALGENDMTPKEIATELNVHRNTVLRYIRTGVFPGAYWINARKVLVPHKEVAALKARTV